MRGKEPFSVSAADLSSGAMVVKSAKDGVRFYASDSLNLASDRRILVQGSMLSDAIKIVGAGFQDPTQMHLAQDNDVVHTLTSIDPISRSAKSFCQGEADAVGSSRMHVVRNLS
jgi:hypothetical protein